jgi:hypothetical protein
MSKSIWIIEARRRNPNDPWGPWEEMRTGQTTTAYPSKPFTATNDESAYQRRPVEYKRMEPEPPNLVLQETPMIFTVPKAGRYCIGADYGQASDETVAALMRIGEDGEPDELISILRRDKETGKWEQECQTK